jgi:hypothetical protein
MESKLLEADEQNPWLAARLHCVETLAILQAQWTPNQTFTPGRGDTFDHGAIADRGEGSECHNQRGVLRQLDWIYTRSIVPEAVRGAEIDR